MWAEAGVRSPAYLCKGFNAKKTTEPTPGAAVSGGALQMFVAAGSRANWHRGGCLVSGILGRFRVDDKDCMARKRYSCELAVQLGTSG